MSSPKKEPDSNKKTDIAKIVSESDLRVQQRYARIKEAGERAVAALEAGFTGALSGQSPEEDQPE